MNHNNQNGLKASALLLGLSVEELIQILHNANSVKEIRTASGHRLSFLLSGAKRSGAKFIYLTIKDAENLLIFLRSKKMEMPNTNE